VEAAVVIVPIRRLLVANRGEIAIRIARGARDLGIVPVGVYSEADADALFRHSLDDARCIGPGPAAESYLDADKILAAARALGADAVHPGYGFLAERAPFAQAVVDAGLIFVGPSPAAIAAMGSKSEAKRLARAAGVPVVDGYDGDDRDDARLKREAAALGVPLVIKAVAGGGGRGMRVVTDLVVFDAALASARREAEAAFGEGSVLLERYLHRPRHIEFQILADVHGRIVHLGERDCSIQRRHQKVVEEAPSPALDPALRARMGAAAVAVARSTGYTNAGTVEFLLAADGTFAFLEMNARLQVEHPVTELVYGIDLVHEQLRIARGEPLRHTQDALVPHGAAIEVRLNAEDPAHDFAPQAGRIDEFATPHGAGVRIDAGVESGSDVPPFYDSLLAKIVVHAHDRAAAVARLRTALAQTHVTGIATNLPLLRAIAADDAFARGETTTAFLTERADALATGEREQNLAALRVAATVLARQGYAWRPAGAGVPIVLLHGGVRYGVTATRTPGGWRLDGDVQAHVPDGEAATAVRTPDGIEAVVEGARHGFRFAPPPGIAAGERGGEHASGDVRAPMPGRIASVGVQAGSAVALHDVLVVLEAMKMEHRIEAPLAGTVRALHVTPGQTVAAGAPLVTIA
jgi:3-methylcrotonyl-CoA carboxylase alpha subunit